LYIKIYYISA